MYEAFWTITANAEVIRSGLVGEVALTIDGQREVAFYALVRVLSVYILNGTSQEARMRSDINGSQKIHLWKRDCVNRANWTVWMSSFEQLVGGANAINAEKPKYLSEQLPCGSYGLWFLWWR